MHKSLIALLLGAVGISFAPIFVRMSEVGPISTAFWRVLLAAPLFWIWHTLPKSSEEAKISKCWLVVPGLFFAGDLGAWHISINYTTIANSTLLANSASVIVALVSWIWLKERLTWVFALGVIIAFAGVTILLGVDAGFLWTESNPQHTHGNLLGLLTAFFYAGYLVSIKKLRDHFSSVQIMAYSCVSCAVVLLPMVWIFQEPFWITSWRSLSVLVGLAIVSHFVGQGLIAFSLARLPASFSSISLLLQPVLATLLAFLLLNEPVKYIQAIGGIGVLVGVYLARKGSLQK